MKIHKHNWTKWKTFDRGSIVRRIDGEEREKEKYIYQSRECKDCGYEKLNKQRT